MYHGYEESQDRITDRMNSKHLAHIAVIYGEGWEQTADAIRPLIAAAEAEFSDVWSDPRTPAERAADEDWQNQQSDRADLLAGLHW